MHQCSIFWPWLIHSKLFTLNISLIVNEKRFNKNTDNQLSSQTSEHKKETKTYGVVNKNPVLGNPQNVAGFYNRIIVFSSPLSENWISTGSTDWMLCILGNVVQDILYHMCLKIVVMLAYKIYTVKPAPSVTSIKQSPVIKCFMETEPISEVTCHRKPLFLYPKGALLIQVLLHYSSVLIHMQILIHFFKLICRSKII